MDLQPQSGRFYHFDFFTQALSKIERGHSKDIQDVKEMVALELIEFETLNELFESLTPSQFARYPSIEFEDLRARVKKLVASK